MTDGRDDGPERDPIDPFASDRAAGDGNPGRDDADSESTSIDRESTDPDSESVGSEPAPTDVPWPSADADAADDGSDRPTPTPESPTDPDEAPLDDLAASVRERRDGVDEGAASGQFEERSVAEIDTDVVWDRLEGESPSDDAPDRREERVVEAAEYCERCPYFSAPPELRCTHDGTEIVEFVDMDSVRVVDCPKVREDERLEDL